MSQVWVLDDDKSIRWVFEKALAKANITFECFSNTNEAINKFNHEKPQAIISDIRMPGESGIEFLTKVKNKFPEIPIIIMTAYSDLDTAVTAFQKGAFEYISKPFDITKVVHIIEQALESVNKKIDNEVLGDLPEIIGQAKSMQDVFRAIGRLSQSNAMVLLNGESGSGKELVAKAIHKNSHRKSNAFIAINAAAIPNDLLEAELFGFEKGAFTGANSQRKGKFEQANQGTLFLDEIGDMPMEVQTRLLRVLQEGEFFRVGGSKPIKVKTRVITATHKDLKMLVAKDLFREDLLHRINAIKIILPSLKDRRSDILDLTNHFINIYSEEYKTPQKNLTDDVKKIFLKYDWPGNIRELQNICKYLTIMSSGSEVTLEDLPKELLNEVDELENIKSWEDILELWILKSYNNKSINISKDIDIAYEKILIKSSLKLSNGNKTEAAKILGWGRNTISNKIKNN